MIPTQTLSQRHSVYQILFRPLLGLALIGGSLQAKGLEPSDLLKLRSVGTVQFSPNGKFLAYTVEYNDGPGRPYTRLWIRSMVDGKTWELSPGKEASADPEWSPDSQWIAFKQGRGDETLLVIAHPDGSGSRVLVPVKGTNSPVPSTGRDVAWAPDSQRVAFINAVPGPETALASGDPIVITRYLYKPDYNEGLTHFNDNRRLHVFVANLADLQVKPLTSGDYYEHSIDWSPDGAEILFVSNRESNQDQFFNYDVFTLRVADGTIRRITATESAEYQPQWSPDGRTIAYLGTRRGLTDLETTMEDMHVWLMNADGTNRRELGAVIDNRQEGLGWGPDGQSVYVTVEDRGSIHLVQLPINGGKPQTVLGDRGNVGNWSMSNGNQLAYSFASPRDTGQLYLKNGNQPSERITDLNRELFSGKELAEVESFTFISNDNKYEVEAFLTRPLGMAATSKYPLIVNIHGGPHGQQGPNLKLKDQIYAARGWATLMVNYRGSTGYGQRFADAVFGDQNGNEAQDVLYGVSAALRRNLWLDRDRTGIEGVSYGGQLTAWLITQTNQFKAAIPVAGIINLVSYNYMTYYNQYEQMEFGIFPHQGNLMDELWRRSALRYVAQVKTPVMLMHGENDSDVPIAESEQFYVALKDVGVETIMIRYPREGHGLREPKHIVDSIERSITWYEKHFLF